MGMEIHPEDETFYATQYEEAFLKQVENEYWAKHQGVLVNIAERMLSSNLIPSAIAFGSGKLSIDTYRLFGDDEV